MAVCFGYIGMFDRLLHNSNLIPDTAAGMVSQQQGDGLAPFFVEGNLFYFIAIIVLILLIGIERTRFSTFSEIKNNHTLDDNLRKEEKLTEIEKHNYEHKRRMNFFSEAREMSLDAAAYVDGEKVRTELKNNYERLAFAYGDKFDRSKRDFDRDIILWRHEEAETSKMILQVDQKVAHYFSRFWDESTLVYDVARAEYNVSEEIKEKIKILYEGYYMLSHRNYDLFVADLQKWASKNMNNFNSKNLPKEILEYFNESPILSADAYYFTTGGSSARFRISYDIMLNGYKKQFGLNEERFNEDINKWANW